MTFETKVISSALFIAAIWAGETRATSSQILPKWRRYPAAVLREPRRTLRYQALNALSSSRRWEYLDTPLFLYPRGTPPEAPAPFNGRHRTRKSAGPTGVEPYAMRLTLY